MRKPGWYHVKDDNGFWECAKWNGHGWNGICAVEAKDGAWLEIGPRIPSHDEKEDWQVVPKEITAEACYKSALIGEFSEKHSDRCPECEAMGDEEDCIICLGTGEVENVTKINAMDAAHREIRRSMRALAIASTMLEEAEMPSACEALSAAYDILGIINEALYQKIHADHEE